MADDLQKQGQLALRDVPALLKRGLDNNKITIKDAGPKMAYGHSAIASVDDDSPNTINIHDKAKFMGAAPFQRTAMLSHELTHRLMDNAPPTLQSKFAPINQTDPYGYDENNLKGKPITNFSGEQLARMVETNQAYQADPSISMARKQQVAAQYAPILSQLQQLPQATVSTDQSQQTPNTMNTAVNPPEAQFDAAPPVVTQPSGPTAEQPWQDDPEPDSQWHDDPEPESMGSKVAGFIGEQGLPIAGGMAGAALGSVGGPPGAMAGGALGAMAGGELNTALRSVTGQSHDTGLARVGNDLSNAAGGTFFGKVEKGIQPLTTAIADSTLPGRSVNALHTEIETAAQKVAAEAGVEVKPTDNVRKIISNTADAVRAKAQEKMDEIDSIYKGMKFSSRGEAGKFASGTSTSLGYPKTYSGFDEQINKLTDKLSQSSGVANIEKRAALNGQIRELTSAKQQAANALDRQLGAGARETAERLSNQADELDNLNAAHQRSTFGMKDQAKANPFQFQKQLKALHETGQLHTALGPQNAEDLLDAADRSSRTFARATKFTNGATAAGKLAAKGAAEGMGVGTGLRVLESITK